jgi:hypothetical protein
MKTRALVMASLTSPALCKCGWAVRCGIGNGRHDAILCKSRGEARRGPFGHPPAIRAIVA